MQCGMDCVRPRVARPFGCTMYMDCGGTHVARAFGCMER